MNSIPILYEDRDLLIVEKPPGIATQPLTPHVASEPSDPLSRLGRGAETLAHLVARSFPEIKAIGGADWGAVHRLDRETSGLVVFARNQRAYEFLRGEFSKNRVEKEYTALVEGTIEKKGRIDWPIGPDPKSSKRVKVYKKLREARRNRAQEAVTTYEVKKSEKNGNLLKVQIKTGRRHQIRAHLAAIGHPIVGDRLYGGTEAMRLHLHASRLSFSHPGTNRPLEVASPPPFPGCRRKCPPVKEWGGRRAP